MPQKILIAEDEKPLAEALKLKLESEGFEVNVAVDGEEAVERAQREEYALILLDLILPKKDGFIVLEELKHNGIRVPIIVISNLGQNDDVARAKKLGAKDYLIKSDTPLSEVVEKIKKYL